MDTADAMGPATVRAVAVGAGRVETHVALAIEVSIRRVAISDGRRISRYADARRRRQSLKRVVLVRLAARR